MTVLTTDRTEIVLPRDAIVEVRDPDGRHIGYYKLELPPPADHGPPAGGAAEPPGTPGAPPAAG